jgi:exopolysaccharide production protein ExoZ
MSGVPIAEGVFTMRSQLDQIQFLRGIAAFSILIAHTPFIQRGHFGVDLFFVISGFIMTYVTEQTFQKFLLKRVVRVVPLYWLGTIGVFVIAIAAPGVLNTATDSAADLLRSLFFIPYFNGRTVEPLLRLGWTLNYEMFFYLLFFVSCVLCHRRRVVIASTLILLLVLIGSILDSGNVLIRFYTDPIQLEFIYGMVAFYVYRAASKSVDYLKVIYAYIGFILGILLYVMLFFLQSIDDQVHRYFFWGLPCLLVFLMVSLTGRRIKIWFGFVMLCNVSYSLYLFHPYVIHLIDRKIYSISYASGTAYLVTLSAYIVAVAVAYFSWLFIEKPSQKYLLPKTASIS